MDSRMTSALVTAEELRIMIDHGDVRVLDASYNLPPSDEGIPGAVDFDIDDVADPAAPYAHTIPSEEFFAEKVSGLGIDNDTAVIVYDRSGIAMAASRAWWMFRLFGHDKVRVLDGGLPAWIKSGGTLEPKTAQPAPRTFSANLRSDLLKTRAQMLDNIGKREFNVLDARDTMRFGAGHIPQSANMPFANLIDPATCGLLPHAKLAATMVAHKGKPVTCTCGSGVTACVVALGLFEAGMQNVAVYDGSWTEWGSDPVTPKAVF